MKGLNEYITEKIGEDNNQTWLFYNYKRTEHANWWTGEVGDPEIDTKDKEFNTVCVSTTGNYDKAENLAKIAYEKKYKVKANNLADICCSHGDKQQAKDIKKLQKLIEKNGITLADISDAEKKLNLPNNDFLGSELYKYFSK